MVDFLFRSWDQMLGRIEGPFLFRFVLQPLTATLLALRAGFSDARLHRTPYLSDLLRSSTHRGALLREGWRDVGSVFIVAVLIDAIYQLMMFGWVYPLQAMIIAAVLAIVPYALVRGPAARTARHLLRR